MLSGNNRLNQAFRENHRRANCSSDTWKTYRWHVFYAMSIGVGITLSYFIVATQGFYIKTWENYWAVGLLAVLVVFLLLGVRLYKKVFV
jgi:ABC-type multidrug transport system permease subunit